jgi:hypothetical protein
MGFRIDTEHESILDVYLSWASLSSAKTSGSVALYM